MRDYPSLKDNTLESVVNVLKFIIRTRDEDITETDNYENIFARGRKVGKIPTSSNDVISSDRIGDFSFDSSYLYLCVLDTGAAKWRRIALATW